MNDTYKLLYFGHYNFTNRQTGVHYTGWSIWCLPNFVPGLRPDEEFGIKPQKFTLLPNQFEELGGIPAFSELLGKDVVISVRVLGKSVQMSGIREAKK